ncbi:formate dehydrogenase accessory sulfurtransferase FdhD [Telmatospirillum sp.]|uniref:formate dehydrogenase accessory sulfurtransferase FdhD n=1 Tax=Telmatospirillum sp. TaxID=2079197 RepID=UPI00284373AD|nr:formate dehydrogenase accessory sulfurtransferase FdhD [Telmatospirillum sp.]MDR3438357.1 formate dehydrogenase accessory sulfurtransferase FdhD [Telmatospirillum sp.]
MPTLRPGSRQIDAVRFSAAGVGPRREEIAEEVPVALIYNRFPFAVMLATPTDLEDFAVGFSLTEGIVGEVGEISEIKTKVTDEGVEVAMTVTKDRYMLLRERHRRNLVAGSSCGLCGSDSFAEALRPVDAVVSQQSFTPQAIHRAMAEFPALQVLNREVGAFHGAAFADGDGRITVVREDIGRHNALDKLIGFLARNAIDRQAGFVAVSSRCSYEMVRKTAAAGIPLIATISAPTSLAIRFAEDTGVGLVAFARESRFNLYATASRISR